MQTRPLLPRGRVCKGGENPYIPDCRSDPAMAINGHRNKPSDPGAVPGASTRARFTRGGFRRGRNRIDEGVKDGLSPGMVSTVIGPNI